MRQPMGGVANLGPRYTNYVDNPGASSARPQRLAEI